ncbi:D-galactarate dehydratase [Paenibacillus sp. JMULE4]|nr:D-galactarate dehydratase [Paenibacillus sp. JMULE4]
MKEGHNVFQALQLHEKDNVAVAVIDCQGSLTITVQPPSNQPFFTITTIEDIPFGHKIALQEINKGDIITKYGRPIGRSTAPIKIGGLVGVHNIEGLRGRGDLQAAGGER